MTTEGIEKSGTFAIGGDLEVHRLGYGAMQITGPGVWGEPADRAGARAALGWEAGKARTIVRAMAADAREYLKASRERGDVYISGKTEEHEPGGVSLGLIVTDTDTAFILIGAEQE